MNIIFLTVLVMAMTAMFPRMAEGDTDDPDQDESLESAFDDALKEVGEDLPEVAEDPYSKADEDEQDPEPAPGPRQEEKPKTQAELAKQAQRPWAGRFKTPEEMEQHLLKVERGEAEPRTQPPQDRQTRQEPQQDTVLDLTGEQIIKLQEHDEADGTDFTGEYFKHKMAKRELTAHEVKALREYDAQHETDLYEDYRELRSERRIMEKLSPALRPLAEQSQQAAKKAWTENEGKLVEGAKAEFGESYDKLLKQSTDVKVITEVLQQSPFAQQILEAQSRSPALANRMLLREIALFNRSSKEKERADKGKRSVLADVGATGRGRRTNSLASSIEDAWDAAIAEGSEN